MLPTHVFVAMTRSRRSSRCLIEPSGNFDFSVFGKGTPLNPKNELLLAHLRGDEDFEEQLVESDVPKAPKAPGARGAWRICPHLFRFSLI